MNKLAMKWPNLLVLIFCLLVCFTLVAVLLQRNVEHRAGLQVSQGNGYAVARHVKYGITIHNETNRLLEEAELWVQAPIKQTATQRCEHLQVSHPHEVIADDRGNQAVHLVFHNLPPYAAKLINVQADLMLSSLPNPIPVQDLDAFLKAEQFIESDDPAIGRLAQSLKAATPLETAEKIFHWVAENLHYTGYLPKDRGALYALKNRHGDCSEFAYLFAACCRANGIPARVLGGYVCTGDRILNPADYHNWAEFYMNGIWQIADPQRKVFMRDASQYVAMQMPGDSFRNPLGESHRFRFSGDGIKVSMGP